MKNNFEQGFILLSRSFRNWKWYGNPLMESIFIDMLLRANYQDSVVDGIPIKRGEFTATINQLCDEWGRFSRNVENLSKKTGKFQQQLQQTNELTVQMVRTIIEKFKETGEIETFGMPKFTIFRIVNYNLYQSPENWKNDCGKPTVPTTTPTTFKINNINNIYAQIDDLSVNKFSEKQKEAAWDNFYKCYPRKQGKKVAEKKFKSVCKSSKDYSAIMDGLKKWIRSKEWSNPQYIPYPGTWLNQERWLELPLEYQIPEGGYDEEEIIL